MKALSGANEARPGAVETHPSTNETHPEAMGGLTWYEFQLVVAFMV
jgi:hypothetical protein